MKPLIVATGELLPPAPELLAEHGRLVVASDPRESTLTDLVADASALVVRGGHRIGRGVIDAAPELRVVARTGVGFDEIDMPAATERGIPVVITPDAGATGVAEGALAMLMALAKGLRPLDAMVREGRWAERDAAVVGDLHGATLGVVGCGRIGRRLIELCVGFEMRILAHDPVAEVPAAAESCDLDELFRSSDFVSLHLPLTPQTRGLVDARRLDGMRPGAVLVNLARGGLVASLDDLHAALVDGPLGGVGLDVFAPEPPPVDHPIFDHPRALFAPHAVGMTTQSKRRIFREAAEGVIAVLSGRAPAAVANPEVLGRIGAAT